MSNEGECAGGTIVDTADLLDGGAGNDTLIGGSGVDRITGGADADTFVQADGSSIGSTTGWFGLSGNVIGGSSQIQYLSNVDVITDFNSATDFLDATASGATDAYGTDVTNLTAGNYYVRGINFNGYGFFAGNQGNDILFYVSTGTDQTVAANIGTTSIVLLGGAANFNSTTNII